MPIYDFSITNTIALDYLIYNGLRPERPTFILIYKKSIVFANVIVHKTPAWVIA